MNKDKVYELQRLIHLTYQKIRSANGEDELEEAKKSLKMLEYLASKDDAEHTIEDDIDGMTRHQAISQIKRVTGITLQEAKEWYYEITQ